MEIIFFNSKAERFMRDVGDGLRPRVARVFELLQANGHTLDLPFSRSIGGKLFELRIIGHVHIRFIYAFYGGKIWILNGFEKKTSRIPVQELTYARIQLKALLQE